MTVPMSRRTFLWRAGLAGLVGPAYATGLAGCAGFGGGSGGSGAGTASAGPASLHVAWWGNASRAKLYQDALGLFSKDHRGVSTTSEYADLAPYLQRLATESAAGHLPDVFWMRDTHIGRYGASGALLDLRRYVGNTIGVKDLGSTAVSDGTVGHGVYALPTHYVGQSIITDTVVFDTLGIKFPSNPTWDLLGQLATEISKSSGQGFWGCNDPTLGSTQRHFEAYVRQTGAELFDHKGQLGFDGAVLGDWLSFWQKLRNAGAIPPPATELQSDTTPDQNLLVTGKAAFLWESSNHLTSWQQLVKHQLDMYSMPTLPNGSKTWWFFPPILISVSAKTKNDMDCAELVSFFLNSKPAAQITRLDQGAPSSKVIREYLLPTLSRTDRIFVDQITREIGYPHRPLPVRPAGADTVNAAIGRTSQQVAYGRQSISDAVKAFQSEAKTALG
jgi:multiple sugar transport system substrate-binding protein